MTPNYPRVNLLHKNEQRYQGVVSRRFMLLSVSVTPILFIAFFFGIQLVQRSWRQSNLEASQKIWADLKPRLEFVNEETRGLKTNQDMLELFAGWEASRLDPVELLDDLQHLIPETIQLSRLSIKNNSKQSRFSKKEDLEPVYTLQVSGLSYGEHAEQAVIQLRKDMLASRHLGGIFNSINLASLRKRKGAEGTSIREFRLVGESVQGGAQ